MRRTTTSTIAAALTLALGAAGAFAALPAEAGAAGWRSEQPLAPSGVPAGIGSVGDLAFWAPDRGLAITAGNDAYPAGVWSYDGVGWRQLSTVCGGHDGRIAWAGPNEFWTVSDAQPGQELLNPQDGWRRSLCHFADGEIVASYAEPVLSSTAYLPIGAAACAAPNDCWFAGEVLPGTLNSGAFHLHWDGSALTAIPSLETLQPELADPARPVADLAYFQGELFESVEVRYGADVPGESADDPFRFHRVQPESSSPFVPVLTTESLTYGEGVQPYDLQPFRLAPGDTTLWGVAGGRSPDAEVTVVRRDAFGFMQQLPLVDPDGTLPPWTDVRDAAAEPGSDSVWVAYSLASDGGGGKLARAARIAADGTVAETVALPPTTEAIGRKGATTAIACPAAGQCWTATDTGWLFHDGDALPRDTGFRFDHLLTLRPRDNSLPTLPPDELPPDDSGAELPPPVEIVPPDDGGSIDPGPASRPRALIANVRSKLIGRTTLRLTFTLRAKASVQAVGRRKGKVVARSKRQLLKAGRRRVEMRLNPRRWPTRLALNASRVGGRAQTARVPGA